MLHESLITAILISILEARSRQDDHSNFDSIGMLGSGVLPMDATIGLYQDILMSSISIRSVLSIRPLFFKTKSSALSPCKNAKRQIQFTAEFIAIRNLEGGGGDATGL